MTEKPNAFTTPNNFSSATKEPTSLVKSTLGDVKHLAEDVVDQTKKTADSQLTSGKTKAAEGLGSVADALRKTGEQLRREDNDMFTSYIDQAAAKVDVASSYLQDRSVTEVLDDVKDFARREPALFLAGGLVIGLLGGRFLKSSTPARQAPRTGSSAAARGYKPSQQRPALSDRSMGALQSRNGNANANGNGNGNGTKSSVTP